VDNLSEKRSSREDDSCSNGAIVPSPPNTAPSAERLIELTSRVQDEASEVSPTPPTVLGAILINPPIGNGSATHRHLEALREVLGCDLVQIANLLSVPTASTDDIREAGVGVESWRRARPQIRSLIRSADHIVLGWGLGGISGIARQHFDAQVRWVERELTRRGEGVLVWTVGDGPRHPSRWHQYVSDKHGRTVEGNLQERLRYVLVDRSVRRSR
jgi:hypothetical protein